MAERELPDAAVVLLIGVRHQLRRRLARQSVAPWKTRSMMSEAGVVL
jgi:hypothetical protein